MEKQLKKWLKSLKLNESTISMILGGLVVVVVGILIYNYFTSVGKQTGQPLSGDQQLTQELTPKGLPTTHIVAAGENLWTIAEKYYGSGYNFVDIAAANKLANPNKLLVGQTLEIPKVEAKTKTAELPTEVKVTPAMSISANTYTVEKGDTLWGIAVKAYQDGYKWPEIAKANADKIANPDKIEVGLVLTLPR
jgi:nucleoid-associated protein YgaU